MTVPLIGIVADRKAASYGSWVDIPTDAISHTYVSAVQEAGGAPIIFPSLDVHVDDPERLIDLVDGLFLPGGRDLDAELYGSVAHPTNDKPLRVRDELEIALTQLARERDIPILGACRGMQVLNVALGGTLEQHLGDRIDLTPHRNIYGEHTSHPVSILPDTLLRSITHEADFEISSHHHQGVDRLGEGLVVSASAPDGVVEAIETTNGAFCLGVQWHPEERLDPEGIALIRAFVQAARTRALAKFAVRS
ncbi:gamma-glutamyl-gamma-aminobutyrate hydrolase family protein [Agromyces mariniharenae]|uniref:Gamma-glutamyl-gamma-aminobutyrate hydrolase family protein n=1 Tax=Agromyces mariniharenae TaxID=2604423 RepID=A0A5S4UWI4_9MICO|nr:gamma-glutamyl-gamma-aminobutyrate hydrolase family protein [Agromyces mariniharenae]TYL50518.1 gamma-glutamyl-gamma-aminobutyrate hydrolase family protein [Agromyces mariniharenae]